MIVQRKIKVIKKAELVEAELQEERQTREAEKTMLKVLVKRYPDEARKFVRDLAQ